MKPYVGLTENDFKTRHRNNTSSFRHRKYRHATELKCWLNFFTFFNVKKEVSSLEKLQHTIIKRKLFKFKRFLKKYICSIDIKYFIFFNKNMFMFRQVLILTWRWLKESKTFVLTFKNFKFLHNFNIIGQLYCRIWVVIATTLNILQVHMNICRRTCQSLCRIYVYMSKFMKVSSFVFSILRYESSTSCLLFHKCTSLAVTTFSTADCSLHHNLGSVHTNAFPKTSVILSKMHKTIYVHMSVFMSVCDRPN